MDTTQAFAPTTEFGYGNISTTFFPDIPRTESPMFEISPIFYATFSLYGNTIISPTVCILGLFGNSIGFYIMAKDDYRKQQSIYIYMLALMVFDNICLLLGLILSTFYIIDTVDKKLSNLLFTHFSFAAGFIDFLTFHVSSILLIVMSSERLHAIVSPFTFKQSWLGKYPYRIIFVTTVIMGLILLPYPFCFKLIELPDHNNDTVYFLVTKTEFEAFYRQYGLVEGILSLLHPIILLAISIAIPVAFRQFQKRRKLNLKNTSYDTQQLKITFMVFCVTALYIFLSIPKVFIQILVFIDDEYNFYGKYGLTFFFFTCIGDVFARINAANDFVIYVLISQHYRRLLRITFCKRCISDREYNDWTEFQISHSRGAGYSNTNRKTKDIVDCESSVQNGN